MKRPIKELKRIARGNLTDRYRDPIRALILVSLFPTAMDSLFSYATSGMTASLLQDIIYYAAQILIMILAGILTLGLDLMHLKMARGENYYIGDLFYCFRYSSDHYCLGVIIRTVLDVIAYAPIFIFFLLENRLNKDSLPDLLLGAGLILLGILLNIYVILTFQLFYFVLLDLEEDSVLTAVKEAFRLMRHNRIRLAGLYLSFLGMYALAFLSFGIGLLWVTPYLKQTLAVFYRDAIGEDPVIPSQEGIAARA